MSPLAPHPLHQLLARAGRPALLLHDAPSEQAVSDLTAGVEGEVQVCPVGDPVPGAPRRWPLAILVVSDALALRRAVSVLAPLGRSRLVAWLLTDAAEPALLAPRPEWPPVAALHGRALASGGALTTLRSEAPVRIDDVLAEVARTVGPPVAALGGHGGATHVPSHPVLGRPPAVVSDPELLAGPLDEGMVNPGGFLCRPTRDALTLTTDGAGSLRLVGSGAERRLPRGVTPPTVAELRQHVGVRVSSRDAALPAYRRAVAALAMAGVPLFVDPADRLPGPAAQAFSLSPALTAALNTHADLASALPREEHSVLLRRAALAEHSTLAWRGRLAGAAGSAWRRFPSCSVILPVQDPRELGFALGQLERQRASDLEIVVVALGWSSDGVGTSRTSRHPVVVLERARATPPQEVLRAAVDASAGDLLLTWKADDWYGPDHVDDLRWARHYSGATLVGAPGDFVYDPTADRTTRRGVETERDAAVVAAGAMLLDRTSWRETAAAAGRDPVDLRALPAAVHGAGGRVYATHGLNHVVRRRSGSDPTEPAEADPARYQRDDQHRHDHWDGFRPSRLVETKTPSAPQEETPT